MKQITTLDAGSTRFGRRAAVRAGAIGALGLGMSDVAAFRSQGATGEGRAKSVIFIFLTGGLSQLESFDMKPDAPDGVRGEFAPIATSTPGLAICEHLPRLAERTHLFSLVRSLGTGSNSHAPAVHMMLTGRTELPPGFDQNRPTPNDWPSLAATAAHATRQHGDLPPAVVLPHPLINEIGKVRPGQTAGRLGPRYEPWLLSVAAECGLGEGACPNCFRHNRSPYQHAAATVFEPLELVLPQGGQGRLGSRLGLLSAIEGQRVDLDRLAESAPLDRNRQQAVSLLLEPRTRDAFEVNKADPETLDRYGRNKFGLSLLMARRLVEAGVNLVQVNLGKNSSWDTHEAIFLNLKEYLLPPTDQAVSALLDDLDQSGLLESTLVVMAGEFGRAPKLSMLPGAALAGRDHWSPVQSLLLAGAGCGGRVIGSTDKIGAYPASEPQRPENLAATVYQALGIPPTATWIDLDGRPHQTYHGAPIAGL